MSRHRYRRDLRPLALVLNDDAVIRALHVDLLQQSGFRALDAETTDEAFDIITRRSDVEVMISGVCTRGAIIGPELVRFVMASRPEIKLVSSPTTHANAGEPSGIVRTVRALTRGTTRRQGRRLVQRYLQQDADAAHRACANLAFT